MHNYELESKVCMMLLIDCQYQGSRGATKGGATNSSTPQPKKVCPVIRPDPMNFFIRGGTCTCPIMDTSVISLQPSQTHTYQTTSVPVFQNSQAVNDR